MYARLLYKVCKYNYNVMKCNILTLNMDPYLDTWQHYAWYGIAVQSNTEVMLVVPLVFR